MKKPVPSPKSMFLKVKCPKCGAEQVIYSHSSMKVNCKVCGETIVKPTGGKAEIIAKKIKRLG